MGDITLQDKDRQCHSEAKPSAVVSIARHCIGFLQASYRHSCSEACAAVLALSHSKVSESTERTLSTSCRDWPAREGATAADIIGAICGLVTDISILMGINIAGKIESIVDGQHSVDRLES